jgi:hypothetical protein
VTRILFDEEYMFKFLQRLFGGGAAAQEPILHLYARCDRCGAGVHSRVHLYNDLSVEYGDTNVSGYTLRKGLMDSRCFRPMQAEIRFDHARRELSRTLEGGTFITAEEYAALNAPAEQAR